MLKIKTVPKFVKSTLKVKTHMCLSNNLSPNRPVTFEDTILYGAEAKDSVSGKIYHYLGYFNSVSVSSAPVISVDAPRSTRRSGRHVGVIAALPRRGQTRSMSGGGGDFGWDQAAPVAKSGNAMLFAVPAKAGTMYGSSLIAVADIPSFMKDLKTAVAPRPRMTRGATRGGLLSDAKSMPIVIKGFDNGTYDVVISPSAAAITKVIRQVSEDKRPKSNAKLYKQLDTLYPGWTFVLFCFSEQDAAQAGCALIKYEPQREDLLYLPGLDGHAGAIEWDAVDLAHTVVVSSDRLKDGPNVNTVAYSDADVSGKHPYLFSKVLGKVVTGKAPQGDFLCQIDDVRQGNFRCKRALPPGTPASVKRGEAHYI